MQGQDRKRMWDRTDDGPIRLRTPQINRPDQSSLGRGAREATKRACTVFDLEAPLLGHFLSVRRLAMDWENVICTHHSVAHCALAGG